jgi:hypothetical protein
MANGDHGATPNPSSAAIGMRSRSGDRSARLYLICSATKGYQLRMSAMACMLDTCLAGVSEIPA